MGDPDTSLRLPSPSGRPAPGPPLALRRACADRGFLTLTRTVCTSVEDLDKASKTRAALEGALHRAVRRAAPAAEGTGGLRPTVLDLSGLGPRTAARLNREVGQCLQGLAEREGVAITRVLLPAKMDGIPPAVEAMEHLSAIELPAYYGTRIDLRALRPDGEPVQVDIQGARQLVRIDRRPHQDVHLDTGSHLRVQERVEAWPEPGEPAREQGQTRPATLGERFYARLDRTDHADDAAYLKDFSETASRGLNGEASFTGTGHPIVCRHLAPAILYERLKWESGSEGRGPREGRFDYRKFASAERIEQTVGPDWERTFTTLALGSARNHVVAVPKVGRFLEDEFKQMNPGESRYFLCTTPNHVMSLRIRLKTGPGGEPVRVIALQDPNLTTTHFRKVVTRPGPLAFDFAQALGPAGEQSMASYFGSDPKDQFALLQAVTLDDFEAARAQRAPAEAAGLTRQLHVLRDESQPAGRCTPNEVRLRWATEIPDALEDDLARTLPALTAGEDRLALLRGKGDGDEERFASEFLRGRPEWIGLILRAAVRGGLPKEDRVALLQGEGGSLLADLIRQGPLRGIDGFFEAMQTLGLESSAIRDLLMTPGPGGWRPLDLAMARGPAVLARFMDGILGAGLSAADRAAVLAVPRPDGRSALQAAMERNNTVGVDTLLRGVLASDLSDDARQRLLLPEGATEEFRLRLAQHPRIGDAWRGRLSRTTLFSVSLQLAAPPPASPQAAAEAVDRARQRLAPYAGAADLSALRGSPDPAELAQFTSALHAVLGASIPLADKVDLLTSADAQGRPLLHRLMAANADAHVERLALALRSAGLGDSRLGLLEGRAAQAGPSALAVAIQDDNALAIRAWMRQTLAFCAQARLPAPERERLLLGLPPGATASARVQAVQALRASFVALPAWSQMVARASDAELAPESRRRLLEGVGRAHLFQPGEVKPATASPTGR